MVKEFADEAQFVDYNIRDNKTAEFAEWDEEELSRMSIEFEVDLGDMGFEFPGDEDFSDKNEEINLDDLDDDCELKIKFDAETYEQVLEALRVYDDDLDKALMKALKI